MTVSRESSIPVIKGAVLGRILSTWGKTCCPSICFCSPGAAAARVASDFFDHGLTGDAAASGFHSTGSAVHLMSPILKGGTKIASLLGGASRDDPRARFSERKYFLGRREGCRGRSHPGAVLRREPADPVGGQSRNSQR
eukprot:3285684-Heterocapsa_arctica.AAC.2